MRVLALLLGYHLVWIVSVVGAGNETPQAGVLLAAAFVLASWLTSPQRGADTRLLLTALALGVLLDGAMARAGLLDYASDSSSWPAPPWILGLWAAFAMTWNTVMAPLRGRPALAAALGALFGPLAYLAANRFGAVTWLLPTFASIALIIGWAGALALLAHLSGRWSEPRWSNRMHTRPR